MPFRSTLSRARYALALAALLSLSACGASRTAPTAPPPLPAPEPETLGAWPELFEVRITPPKRDILGAVPYDLPLEANSWVEAELDFLVNERSEVIGRWMERGEPYRAFIQQELRAAGIPTDLYHLAMIESGMVPTARSRAGAVGFWQFMPATGRQMGLRVDDTVDERMDPVRATRAAARHLRSLHRQFNGDWALAAAAYNAGSGRISRSMGRFGVSDFWSLAEQGDLAEETRHYVPRLYAMTVIGRDHARFGLPAPAPAAAFAYDSIQVEYATPLEELSRMSEVSAEELRRLNPHLVQGITPDGGYWVWVPAGQGVAMQRAYLASDFRRSRGLGTYTVRPGDSLGKLANLSGLTTAKIRELNPGVRFEPLQIGVEVRLPYEAAEKLSARTVAKAEPTRVASAAQSPAPEEKASTTAGGAAARTHAVRQGESLWEIARRYDLTVAALQRENGLTGATIRPGQELRIPGTAEVAAQVEHVVESGETLWGIARKYDSSVEAIQGANGMGDRPIRPGERLVVPVGTN